MVFVVDCAVKSYFEIYQTVFTLFLFNYSNLTFILDAENIAVDDDPNAFFDKSDEGFEQMDPSQAYAAIAAADARLEQLRSEPEKIRLWREEQTKYLNEKG